MADQEFDPIQIKISAALDRRFANFDFASDNSPRDPDNSIAIRGSVAFGERRQSSTTGRSYWIGVKCAFLEIGVAECRFEPNMDLQEQVQKGSFEERAVSKERNERNAKIDVGVSTNFISNAANGKVGAGHRHADQSELTGKRQYEQYRVRWEAGGCRFGQRRFGDPYNQDGILQGTFLYGTWGRLIPNRGVSQYGADIKLLLQKGDLSVVPEAWSVKDLNLAPKERQEADAFEALKAAVAAWAVESSLHSNSYPDGHDQNQKELVLAHGQIAIELIELHNAPPSRTKAIAADVQALSPPPGPKARPRTRKLNSTVSGR